MKLFYKAIALMIILSAIFMSLTGCTKKASTNVEDDEIIEEGKLLITVTDKAAKKPIADAKIVIAGIDNFYKTDEKGHSPVITMEVNKDIYKKYGAQLLKKAPSGTATIIVTKEGYKDYILFDKPIYPGQSANNVNIQMVKPDKNDSEKYVADNQRPHDLWIQELVAYCNSIKEEKEGSGEYKITVSVKDSKSKPVEGAFIVIPELGIRVLSDKEGKGILKPTAVTDMLDIYPVKKPLYDYTVVVGKEGLVPSVIFNVAAGEGKEGSVNVVLKTPKSDQTDECTIVSQPYDKEWVSKVIGSFKEQQE